MSTQALTVLVLTVALVALGAAALAWITSVRWAREHRAAMDRAVESKAREIVVLERQIEFFQELDSVKFADRYIDAKRALEEHVGRLGGKLQQLRQREEAARRQIQDLSASEETKAAESSRLRAQLAKTQHDTLKLEQVVQAVHTVGPIPLEEIKRELAVRRRWQAEIQRRIQQLGLEGEARHAELERLENELEHSHREAEKLAREIEVTRAAGPIVDAMLGITPELRERMAQLSDQLGSTMRRLSEGRGRDPAAEFLRIFERGQDPQRRLLEAGGPAPAAVPADPQAAQPPADQREQEPILGTAPSAVAHATP